MWTPVLLFHQKLMSEQPNNDGNGSQAPHTTERTGPPAESTRQGSPALKPAEGSPPKLEPSGKTMPGWPESAPRRPPASTLRSEMSVPAASEQSEALSSGLRFVHLMNTQLQARVADISASFHALLETLIADGRLPLQAYEQRREVTAQRENERCAQMASVQLADIPDKYADLPTPDIDCKTLLPLCRARCCKLGFTLSVQDLNERLVRWDYGQPYVIARDEAGYCAHHAEGRCNIYLRRPGTCRLYDCREDPQIWTDFEKRIPAP